MQLSSTPYEQFLRQSIEDQKAERDKLFNEFAHANPLRKQLVKRKIEEINQNLSLLSADLEKYKEGLEWLREPSKERDEKAEHLPKLAKEEAAPAPAAAPAAGGPKPAVSRPTIGKPIGSAPAAGQAPAVAKPPVVGAARPTIGTPVGRPQIGSPVGTPKPDAAKQIPLATSTPVARPQIGTPISGVKRPVIGTPIGTPKTEPAEKKSGEEDQANNSTAESATSS
jgi:hypothetical protein